MSTTRDRETWATMTPGRRLVIIGAALMVVAVPIEVISNDGGWNWGWLPGGIGIALAAIVMLVGVFLDWLVSRKK